jgi:hypothetical protein
MIRNEIYDSGEGHVALEQDANNKLESSGVFAEVVEQRIQRSTSNRGYIELFSDARGFNRILHFTALVGGGDFSIDHSNPGQSFNTVIIESVRTIRFGDQYISETE